MIPNFINDFLAQMEGTTTENYKSVQGIALRDIDSIEKTVNLIKIKTLDDYKMSSKIKSALSSLYCYTFNNKLPEFDKITKIESNLGQKMFKFIKRNTIKNSEAKTVARYVLWGKYYSSQKIEEIYEILKKHNILRKKDDRLCIVGLHYKVGDNIFTVDYNGRNHRTYIQWAGFQAIFNKNRQLEQFITYNNKWEEIPELENFYETIGIHDGKYAIRPFGLSEKERSFILKKYTL